jgi:predicted acetyltransferase
MDALKLIAPSAQYADQIRSYRQEFLDHNESMDGTARLRAYENPLDWLIWIEKTACKETCPPDMVPDSTFLCVRVSDNKLVGMVNIRHTLNGFLLRHGGHIGYSIRRSERRKGYAKEQLRLALLECGRLGIKNVLITCDQDNEGSRRTILSARGVLENEISSPEENAITQRYWISL